MAYGKEGRSRLAICCIYSQMIYSEVLTTLHSCLKGYRFKYNRQVLLPEQLEIPHDRNYPTLVTDSVLLESELSLITT